MIKEDTKFLRDENTNLSIELTELKYDHHNIEEERNSLELKHDEA